MCGDVITLCSEIVTLYGDMVTLCSVMLPLVTVIMLQDKAELSRQQASVILDNIRGHHDNRMSAASRCDSIIATYKSSKDQKKFRIALREINNRYTDATNNINNLQKELANLDPDNAAKV